MMTACCFGNITNFSTTKELAHACSARFEHSSSYFISQASVQPRYGFDLKAVQRSLDRKIAILTNFTEI